MKYLNTFGDGNKGGGTKGGANPKPPGGRNPRAKDPNRGAPEWLISQRKREAGLTKGGVKKGPPPRTRKPQIGSLGGPPSKAKPGSRRFNYLRDLHRQARKVARAERSDKGGVKKGPPTRAKAATTSTRGGPVTKAMMAASRRNAARRDLRARSRKIFGDLV